MTGTFVDLVPRGIHQEHRLTLWKLAESYQHHVEQYERAVEQVGKRGFAALMWHARLDTVGMLLEHFDLCTHRMMTVQAESKVPA